MILSQEVSEEWENLIDEWEQVVSHKERLHYLQQAMELNNRLPIPPTLHWKYQHIAEHADLAQQGNAADDQQAAQVLQ